MDLADLIDFRRPKHVRIMFGAGFLILGTLATLTIFADLNLNAKIFLLACFGPVALMCLCAVLFSYTERGKRRILERGQLIEEYKRRYR